VFVEQFERNAFQRDAVIDRAAGTERGRIGNLNPQSAVRKK
jgi:hypothetical protein